MSTAPSPENEPLLASPPATIHFIGIGGISMSGIARMLHEAGYTVTGSDSSDSAAVQSLREIGIDVVIGHFDPALASRANVVVTTKRAEIHAKVELDAARINGAKIVKRPQVLGMLANARRSLAVAGTHGKSTTSGLATVGLLGVGEDPGFAVGATIPGLAGNTRNGGGEIMVLEADEFDRSFLWFTPTVAIITSVSFDHPDIYTDQADYDAAFVDFARNIKPGGTLVIAGDDAGCQRIVAALQGDERDPSQIQTFGQNASCDWTVSEYGTAWQFTGPNGFSEVRNLSTPGQHNARNAVAALAGVTALGFDPAEVLNAMTSFTGVGRRFERKGTVNGIDVVDDYAHHPDEITAILAAARKDYPNRRIIAVHQPHTYSRTKALLGEFSAALDGADQVVLLDIYPSGEEDSLGISSQDVLQRLTTPAVAATGPEDAARITAESAKSGDVILTLGAGDITRTGDVLLELLRKRTTENTEPVLKPRPRRAPVEAFPMPGADHLKVTKDASMAMYTTMRVGGPADYLVRVSTPDDLVTATQWARNEGLPVTMAGGGSNMLVADDGIRGAVIVARTPGERAGDLVSMADLGEAVEVTVGAMAPLSWFGRHCAENGWSGMDWGVGLPGQIGGATANNAGAHGTELKDHLYAIDLLLDNGRVERVPHEWLQPTYRMTRIKGAPRPRPWVVLGSVFRLPKGDPVALVALADDHAAFRKRTQPTGACSGSTFANPPGDYAGRLLEAAGMKGFAIGAMEFSHKHANWVVNQGGGSATDAWELIRHAQTVIRDRYGIVLKPEIERVGQSWNLTT